MVLIFSNFLFPGIRKDTVHSESSSVLPSKESDTFDRGRCPQQTNVSSTSIDKLGVENSNETVLDEDIIDDCLGNADPTDERDPDESEGNPRIRQGRDSRTSLVDLVDPTAEESGPA